MDGCTVLIGFAESLAAIEVAWDLLDHGFEVHAFSRARRRPPIAFDPRVIVHRVPAPEVDADATVEGIGLVAEQLTWPVLMPLDDVALWVLSRLSAREPLALVAGPTGARAEFCLDKREQCSLAAQAGLAVPATLYHPAGSAPVVPDFEAPWVVKPRRALEVVAHALVKGATQFATSGDELERVLAARGDDLLIQPFVRGTGQGVFGHAVAGRVDNWSGHRRIRMMNPSGSGSSACRSMDPDADLVAASARFIEQVSWDGMFMLEYLTDQSGTSWFMELNGRAWGSMVLATHRGLAYPTWTVLSTVDPTWAPHEVVPGPHVTARHLGREALHLAFRARDRVPRRGRSSLRSPAVDEDDGLTASLVEVLRWRSPDRAYNARRGHRRVLVADTIETVLGRWLR